MTTLLLHLSDVDEAALGRRRIARRCPASRVVRRGDDFDPAAIDYAFVWKPKPDAFDGLTGLKAVLSLGAGVDALLRHPQLPAGAGRALRRRRSDAADDRLCRGAGDHAPAAVHPLQRRPGSPRWTQLLSASRELRPMSASWASACWGLTRRSKLARSALLCWAGAARPRPSRRSRPSPARGASMTFLRATDILCCLLPLTPETSRHPQLRDCSGSCAAGSMADRLIVNAARGGHQNETRHRCGR